MDIRRVPVPLNLATRVFGDISCGHCDRSDPLLAARLRHIDRVLGENHRIIVSKRNRPAPEPLRRERDLLWRRGIGELVPLARFGDVPVLAKPAAKIAPRGAEREHACSRQKMIQRFLFNGIDTKSAAPAISRQNHSIARTLPNETEPTLTIIKFAKSRTKPALNAPI